MPDLSGHNMVKLTAAIIVLLNIAGLIFLFGCQSPDASTPVTTSSLIPTMPPRSTIVIPDPSSLEITAQPVKYLVKPGESIQNVLNQMPGGQTCFVKPGVYPEALTIRRSGQTIQKFGSGEVIIDGGGAANTVLINNFSNTTLQGLIIRNSSGSLIKITGSEASHNTVRQCTLLEWGLDGVSTYVGAVDSCDGASYTTVDLCYIDRGNHEAVWTQNPEAISYHYSGGYHTITNNIIWGVCRDNSGNPIEVQSDFGDGYPLYKFNLLDSICGLDGLDRLDFDGTVISGNHFYGAHDDIIGLQGLGRNCSVTDNYIDSMGGSVCIVLRGASIGPLYIARNICVNSGINCFKYASWQNGSGMAVKYIFNNTYYSTLSRGYTSTETTWYIPVMDKSYSRFIDGEVNGSDYDNLQVIGNNVLCRTYFLCLMPGSGSNNIFFYNRFSTLNPDYCVKWYSDTSAIGFKSFNSLVGDTNVWSVIPLPSEPPLPVAGAG